MTNRDPDHIAAHKIVLMCRARVRRMMIEEVAMAALVRKTGSRLVRWFKQFKEANKSPYKWYEHDHYGI